MEIVETKEIMLKKHESAYENMNVLLDDLALAIKDNRMYAAQILIENLRKSLAIRKEVEKGEIIQIINLLGL